MNLYLLDCRAFRVSACFGSKTGKPAQGLSPGSTILRRSPLPELLLACDGHQRLGCHRICVQGLQQLHLGVHLFAEGLGFPDSAITVASVGATLFEVQSDALHGSEGALHLGLIRGMVGDREGAIVDIQRVLSRPSAFRPQMLRHDSMFASMLEDPRLRRFVETPGVVP